MPLGAYLRASFWQGCDWPLPDEPRKAPRRPHRHPPLSLPIQLPNHPPNRKQQHPTLLVRPNPRNWRLKPQLQQQTHHSLPRLPPPTTKADDTTVQPKPASPPPPDTQPTPVAATPRDQNQATTPTDTPAPPELKAFTDALKDVKAYIDDKSKVLLEVKNLLETKGTQATTSAPTTDLGPTLDAALKPLSETLSTIDSTTAGSSRDLSNHIWECGGRHQAMDGTLSGVPGMVRDLQNRVGTTQRKLDDWSDSTGTMDDSPGVTKCLCQLREVQDELSRSSQSTEALTQRVDSITESIGTLSTRIQSMQTLLDKMAAARPKAPPPTFLSLRRLHISPPLGQRSKLIQAPPTASQGAPAGANVINLNPPPQQDTVTVWMEGRAFQIPTTMVRGIN